MIARNGNGTERNITQHDYTERKRDGTKRFGTERKGTERNGTGWGPGNKIPLSPPEQNPPYLCLNKTSSRSACSEIAVTWSLGQRRRCGVRATLGLVSPRPRRPRGRNGTARNGTDRNGSERNMIARNGNGTERNGT
eukprot:gene12501-biopygen7942